MTATNRIPVAAPDLSGNEEKYVVDAIRSSWISSTGPYLQRFEKEFAGLCATRAAIAVCNGTVALHLTMLALDVRGGDEVLVPSLTYIATANACRYVGAEPVFVDVDPQTWCMDPKLLEAAITRRTKGIIAVHLYGHPADMDAINHIAAVHGLWVVEDAAEAHFAQYRGRPVGSLAPMATFSFYGNKMFTCGEGGAITLSDPKLELRTRTLRGQGMDPQRRYYFPVTGYNFRLTNLAAAMLCANSSAASRSPRGDSRFSRPIARRWPAFPASAFSRSRRGPRSPRGCSASRFRANLGVRATSWLACSRPRTSRRGRSSWRCTACLRSARNLRAAARACP